MTDKKEEMLTFSIMIEKLAIEKRTSYTDAIVLHCEQTGLEVEVAAKLVSNALKSKIKIEAESLNLIQKSNTNKLPL